METTKIIDGVEAIETALWFPVQKVLVIGDVHMGYEESLSKRGFLIPRTQFKESVKSIKKILSVVKPKLVIINGDLKHEFGEISSQEWIDISRFLDIFSGVGAEIILVKGNHDTILKPIADKKKIKLVDYYCFELFKNPGKLSFLSPEMQSISKEFSSKPSKISKMKKSLLDIIKKKKVNSVCIMHGHKEFDAGKKADLVVIGNDHPAVFLEEGVKKEKYKCFLLGKWKKQRLISMPSFFPMIEGTDVKREFLLSPFLQQNLDNFEVFIVGDKVYKFGKLKNL